MSRIFRLLHEYNGQDFPHKLAAKKDDLIYFGWNYLSNQLAAPAGEEQQAGTWAWGALIEKTGVVRSTWGLFFTGSCEQLTPDQFTHDGKGNYLRTTMKACAAETILAATARFSNRWFIAEEAEARACDPLSSQLFFDKTWQAESWRDPPLDPADATGYDDEDRVRASTGTAPELKLDWTTVGHFVRCALALASALREVVGIAPRSAVALCSATRLEWAIADVACIFASYVSVPLYPTAGVEAQRFILQQAEVQLVVCDLHLYGELRSAADANVRFVVMGDASSDELPADDRTFLMHELVAAQLPSAGDGDFVATDGNALATIMYTSGSTGLPKGAVMSEQRWHTHVAKAYTLSYPLHLIGYGQVAHIMERQHIYLALLAGGRYFLYRRGLADAVDVIRRYRPTQLSAVPGFLQQLHSGYLADRVQALTAQLNSSATESNEDVAAGRRAQPGKLEGKTDKRLLKKWRASLGGRLQYIVVGGALPSDELMAWLRRCFDCQVFNGYGATETGGIAQDNTILPDVDVRLEDAPELGYLTTDLPYPRGQIVVRSGNMIQGYFKNETATAEHFTPDGYWRSGDIGVLLPNRSIRIVDRVKNIFKLAQGKYVAPEPLEQLFLQSPFVRQCFVYGDIDQSSLVAVVVPMCDRLREALAISGGGGDDDDDDDDKSDQQLCTLPSARSVVLLDLQRIAQQAHLPGHEHPQAVHLAAAPFSAASGLLTPSGKLKRAAVARHFADDLQALYDAAERTPDFGTLVLDLVTRAAELAAAGSGAELQAVKLQLGRQLELFIRGAVDSLSAINLLVRLRSAFPAACLSLESLYRCNVDQFLALLSSSSSSSASSSSSTPGERQASTQLLEDWRLSSIEEVGLSVAQASAGESGGALVTGGTGQIGCQLVHHLLQSTSAQVFCLVRASNASSALDRLLAALRQRTTALQQLTESALRRRIVPLAVSGQQLLQNLSPGQLEQLASCVSTVYHVAAHVSWSRPYDLLRQSNVAATCDLLDLCARHSFRLVYISTVGVAKSLDLLEDAEVRDLDSLLDDTGYAQTKTVAERFVRQAISERGLRGLIVRPAMITGHSELGACQASDYVACLLRGIVQLACYLDDEQHFQDMLPVDIAARQIFGAAQAFSAGVLHTGDTLVLADQQAPSYAELGRIVSDWCVAQTPPQPPLTPVSYPAFCRAIEQQPSCPLAPFLQTVLLPTGIRACPAQLSTPGTNRLFAQAGIDQFTLPAAARRDIIFRSLRFLFDQEV